MGYLYGRTLCVPLFLIYIYIYIYTRNGQVATGKLGAERTDKESFGLVYGVGYKLKNYTVRNVFLGL